MLDAMGPPCAASRQHSGITAAMPTRFAALYFPNGAFMDNWVPKQTGPDYELPFSLTPLAPVKSEVLVLSGLDKPNSRQGDGHYAKTANFLTGLRSSKTTGNDLSVGGQSLDQIAASRIGELTPLPSLELAIDPVISGIDSIVGYTRLYGSFISWRPPTCRWPVRSTPAPPTASLRRQGAAAADRRRPPARRRGKSLLDMALEDARSLRHSWAATTSSSSTNIWTRCATLKRRLAFIRSPIPGSGGRPAPNHPDEPAVTGSGDHREHVRLMLDLIVLAFWTDTTRLSTFMFANSVSNKNFSQLIAGVHGGHHELSHHQSQAAAIEQYSKINGWHIEQFVYLLEKCATSVKGRGPCSTTA